MTVGWVLEKKDVQWSEKPQNIVRKAIIQLCEWYARCDWSLFSIYRSTDTCRMTLRETCFFVLFNIARGFENVCEITSD